VTKCSVVRNGHHFAVLFFETSCRAEFASDQTLKAAIEAALKLVLDWKRRRIHKFLFAGR
jgi:hypothetical protein